MDDSIVSSIDYDKIVKFTYEGSPRFAFAIESIGRNVIDEAGARWLEVSGRGVLALLENAGVYPFGGMTAKASDVRWFNFGALDAWDHDLGVTWGTPEAVVWADADSGIAGYPLEWPDPDASWIWATDPMVTSPPNTNNWFRKQFTISGNQSCRIYATCDNAFELYIDGEVVLSCDLVTLQWTQVFSTDIDLIDGDHVIAIKGMNGPEWTGPVNPASLIAEIVTLTPEGDDDTLVVCTDATWDVSEDEPRWYAGDVLFTLVTEAQARDVDGVNNLTMDFDAAEDSNGNPWSTQVARSWDVVNTDLLVVAQDLAELGLDVWVTPDMVLHAAESRGVDNTDVVLSDDTSVTRWAFSGSRATGTHGWIRNDRGWTEVSDSAGETAHGRREIGISLGASDSDDQATDVVRAAFNETASPREVVTDTALIPASGAKAYVDFNVGDTVTGINSSGSTADVRLLSITVVQSDDAGVTYTPELEVV
jgi:hypothetical protein